MCSSPEEVERVMMNRWTMKRLAMATLVAGLVVACADLPLKQVVSASHQTVRQAMTTLDDTERQLCAPDPAVPSHCTLPTAVTFGLTDARHQAFRALLVKAYDVDVNVSKALIAWRSGDPIPPDLLTLLADANEAVTQLATFAPDSQLSSQAKEWVSKTQALVGQMATPQ